MGATTWDYFVPYEESIEAALQQLRQRVFQDGSYERFVFPEDGREANRDADPNYPGGPLESQLQQLQMREGETMLQWAARMQNLMNRREPGTPNPGAHEKPLTIEELLEEQGESGTHSILDIDHVSPTPAFGAVCPLPTERVREIFGTDKPTRELIEGKRGAPELVEDPFVSERWQGTYVIAYRDGKPHEIFFIGTSGD
jgi:hypothetical protein